MSNEFKAQLYELFSRITKAMGSPNRLHLLELLAQCERSVESLAALTGMSVANTSRHLQQLRQAGLVQTRKDGLYVYYRVSGGGVMRLMRGLGEVAESNLVALLRFTKAINQAHIKICVAHFANSARLPAPSSRTLWSAGPCPHVSRRSRAAAHGDKYSRYP